MKEYYIEEFEADIETFEFDTLDISEDIKEPEDAVIDKKEFEIVYFLDEFITKKAGNPPSGSGFDYISYESDWGESYYTFVYKYNPEKKKHKEYLKKVYNLYYSEEFLKEAKKLIETKYLLYLVENEEFYE
jgi:hypothetical protein